MEVTLYQPDIAGNLGAAMRSCACFDTPLSIIEPCGFPFTTRGATPLPDFKFQPNDRLLFGRESAGVPDNIHDASNARVVIPIINGARSFNLSVSVGIALFEALRQTESLPRL